MRRSSTARVVWSVVRWRWWIVGLAGLFLIVVETIEHLLGSGTLDGDYLPTISRFGVALPLAGGVVLSLLGQAMSESQSAAVQTERRRIARELHDTLEQNLGYLHLKLENLTANDTLDAATLQELQRMRTIVDDAYQQIRGTLTELDPGDVTDVVAAIFDFARSLGRRSNFQVDFAMEGKPSGNLLLCP